MFRQLTILKSILVAILMMKHHSYLDMVRIVDNAFHDICIIS